MMTLSLFGATRVQGQDGRLVEDLGGIKPRQILEILGCSLDVPVAKDRLADLLWDGRPPRSYVGTLETYVCLLRRAMGAGRGRGSAIATTSAGYLLDGSVIRVDLAEARDLAQRAVTAPPRDVVRVTDRALGLRTGELLASDAYAGWAQRERDTFHQEIAHACTRAAAVAVRSGSLESAVRLARWAVADDPHAEEGWQHLMHALWRAGRRSEALRAYFVLRDQLVRELGTWPGSATQRLYMEILRDEPADASTPGGGAEIHTLLELLQQALSGSSASALAAPARPHVDAALRSLNATAPHQVA